jgi:hypothetical protein
VPQRRASLRIEGRGIFSPEVLSCMLPAF